MARPDPKSIERLIESILDEKAVDWSSFEALDEESAREIDALHTLADIAQTFRRFDTRAAAPLPATLFRWGQLAIQECVGEGGSSEIYRAWDAGLGMPVALKMLKPDGNGPTTSAFLDEARRLARIRHRNVLSVYGAGIHDGRPGLWCEWIDGCSLSRHIAEVGPLGVSEAAILGISLCRALTAVHDAGLLHGDVKADNVMREKGGRIVLADLGAGGEPDLVNASLRSAASPAWLAPEVLRGAKRTPQQDLYALGGVLQFVLEGKPPDPLRHGADLERKDIPSWMRVIIARARAENPASRFADAKAMSQALAAGLHEEAPAPVMSTPLQGPSRKWRVGLMCAGLASVFAIGLLGLEWTRPPSATKLAELSLHRYNPDSTEILADRAEVSVGDRLGFRMKAEAPLWMYVYNEDENGDVHRLFPLPALETTNPLPANRRIDIPGAWQGRAMHFEVSSESENEVFLVVLAASPITFLELKADDATGADAEIRPRGTDRLVPSAQGIGTSRLDRLAQRIEDEAEDVQLWRFHLPHRR